ncbi:MAG: N-acetylmuramoyl-L-alanine amidase [Chthoniobacter sp.]|nr:N-acetylmuramoyl-L-alanine amidase [Chthoniobacter sp.]
MKNHSTAKLRRHRFLGKLARPWRVQNALPCVGLVVLAGCLTFIVAPDDEPSAESRLASTLGSLPTVVIDPGHGGNDDGARSHGLREKDLSLDLALRVEKLLRSYSFPAVLTRREDTFMTLPERTAVANRIENAIFVSLHFNHSRDSSATGVETFYATEKVPPESSWAWVGFVSKPEPVSTDIGADLAGYIQTALVTRTNAANRGIKQRELYVVRHTRCPAVLVEGGFLNNVLDARLIANGEYLDRLAQAIVEGVITYQKNRPPPVAPPPKIAAH